MPSLPPNIYLFIVQEIKEKEKKRKSK